MDISAEIISGIQESAKFRRYGFFAEGIISTYQGKEPFNQYLRKYFSSNKKHGSKDRKQIASLCYSYFRVCTGIQHEIPFRKKLAIGNFLCESQSDLSQERNDGSHEGPPTISEKSDLLQHVFDSRKIFPFNKELSGKINVEKFNLSFLKQPDFFLRIRPGKESTVLKKLHDAKIPFRKIDERCLVFPSNAKVSDIISLDKEAVVQDYNSQRVGGFFPGNFKKEVLPVDVWDCCAGSGGKSILLLDTLSNIQLTVTDKRPGIIKILQSRFANAGIKKFKTSVLDLSSGASLPIENSFKIIIADLPCSGSGTWARTPESLSFFRQSEIQEYASLQRKIIQSTLPQLTPGGVLLYITCSVFAQENEDNIEWILKNSDLKLSRKKYLEGYEMKADTLFVAALTKPS